MSDFLVQVNGEVKDRVAATSGGGGDANKIPKLDGSGLLAGDMIPVLPESKVPGAKLDSVTVGSDVTAGQFVNLSDNAGLECRPADNSNGRIAHGYVKDSVTAGNPVTVYFDLKNTDVTPTTPGATQFLGTAGAITETAPTASGSTVQKLGVALSNAAMLVEIAQPITIE